MLVIVVLVGGCSSGGNPSTPGPDEISGPGFIQQPTNNTIGNNYLLFNYLIYIDPTDTDNIRYEIAPLRESAIHLNILKFLEEFPCTNCFKITGFSIVEPGVMDVDIEISHPFADPDFTIFDVRGIMMFGGSFEYPVSGLSVSDSLLGDGELLNADGCTALYNPATIDTAPGPLFGYYKGKLATDILPDADVNGFKRHVSSGPINYRNALFTDVPATATYRLKFQLAPFVLGYAVDANWAMPLNSPVSDPMNDFGPNANCPEPWKLDVSEVQIGGGLTTDGGGTMIVIDVYDWEGKTTYSSPIIESPELFDTPAIATWVSDGVGHSRFEAMVTNSNLAGEGEYRMLVSVEAHENDPSGKPWMDLTAYRLFVVEVTTGQPGEDDPIASATADPNPQIVGLPVVFDGTESVDPDGGDIVMYEWQWESGGTFEIGDEIQSHTYLTIGSYEVQLRVTDDEDATDTLDLPLIISIAENPGEGIAQTWGGSGNEFVEDIVVDSQGNVFIVGEFNQTVDFDPGPGTYTMDSAGLEDIFISKFGADGLWQWTRVIGGAGTDKGLGIQLDGVGSILVTGYFEDTVDFDPGENDVERTSAGYSDAYVANFTKSGDFYWVKTWGGGSTDAAHRCAVDVLNNIIVVGSFAGTVDFDPGEGEDPHTSINVDVSLMQLSASGNYIWGVDWGNMDGCVGNAIDIDFDDQIYVLGNFESTVDFDPGPGETLLSSHGQTDVYINQFDPDGLHVLTYGWGGTGSDTGNDLFIDGDENFYVTGGFQDVVDLDPTSGYDLHTANGSASDAYFSVFNSLMQFAGARTWGGPEEDAGYDICTDNSSRIFAVGTFRTTADFDPTGGEDYAVSEGEEDAFLAIYDYSRNYLCVNSWGGSVADWPTGIVRSNSGELVVTGHFRGDADFDPGPLPEIHSSNGNFDAFISRPPYICK